MVKFYTSKELSEKFDVNLARWKRWAREFLPPDPLGGLQSGYARQYSCDDAFTVVLGGHLVGELKFSIPETRRILADLHQWLVDHDFYIYLSKSEELTGKPTGHANSYQIAIAGCKLRNADDSGFFYRIRGLLADSPVEIHGSRARSLQFTESFIPPEQNGLGRHESESYRVINISGLYKKFLNCLED